MDTACEYFSSDHWRERIRSHLDRVWDITDLFDRLDTEREREEILSAHIESTDDDINRETLIKQHLSECVQRDWNLSTNVSLSDAIEVWESTRDFTLPKSCPHEAADGEYCVFHRPIDEKDDAAVRDEFLSTLRDEGSSSFVGARFGDLDLSRRTIGGSSRHAIVCRFVSIHGRLGLTKANITQDIDLHGAEITAPACSGATFRGDIICMDAAFGRAVHSDAESILSGGEYEFSDYFAEFAGEISFAGATFEERADFKRVDFGGDTSFNNVTFGAVAVYNYASFDGQADFMHAVFEKKADFSKATFADYAVFYAIFRMKAVFNYTTFEGEADFWSADFHDMTDFWVTEFHEDADFRHVDFYDYTSFRETHFKTRADFNGVDFYDGVRFDRLVSVSEPINLSDATLSTGEITQLDPGRCLFDFENATVGDVRLDGPEPAQLFDDFRFLETNFDGFDFASHRTALGDSWDIHTFGNEEKFPTERLESTYLRAKNGANQVGDSKAASEFFLKEMRYRRQRYARNSARGRWAVNWFYNLTCGYGERPLRTVGFSLAIITGFAVLYGFSGMDLGNPVSYLVFSLQSFVTLILGGVASSQSTAIRFAAAFEAFIGAFFIALFVFALTRTIHR